MLRRTCFSLSKGSASAASATSAAAGSGAALGLGDQPIFRVSQFLRAPPSAASSSITPEQLAAEGLRTGRDAASASVIDYVELQWQLIPYRFRKLCLEIVEVRRNGVMASLPTCYKTLLANVFLLVAVYMLCFRIGRGSLTALRYPKVSTPAAAAAATPAASTEGSSH